MVTVALIRHGITAWNLEGRIQGRTDVPLSPAGREILAARVLPQELKDMAWVASPLVRARETASILSGRAIGEIEVDDRLAEMSWGQWEGAVLEHLRQRHGVAMADNEALGLHFRPPGGESPFEVQARVREWLTEVARAGDDVVAVTHKGVIRALMARALGWDMTGKPPVKLDWSAVHRFEVAEDGGARVVELNGGGHG
jgi:broad specificity phosphatase PhoE